MTLSPTEMSSGMRSSPSSFHRPGPTAMTSPSWGFSFAVSGITRPEAVVSSASRVLTRMRSSSGLMLTDTSSTSPICFSSVSVTRSVSTWVSTPALRVLNRTYARPSTRSSRVPTSGSWHDRAVDLVAFEWLLTPQGQSALGEAGERLSSGDDLIGVGERLRRRIAPEQAAVVSSQATLRAAARVKFGELADRLYFTPEGLEQATRPELAEHRAARIASAAPPRLADLGCGIGADLVAFARAGISAAGFDLDQVRVAVARANLAALGLPVTAEQADATAIDLTPYDVVFTDP